MVGKWQGTKFKYFAVCRVCGQRVVMSKKNWEADRPYKVIHHPSHRIEWLADLPRG